jgi:hypothetical protein
MALRHPAVLKYKNVIMSCKNHFPATCNSPGRSDFTQRRCALIRLRMHQKRVNHVPTEKELANEARYK